MDSKNIVAHSGGMPDPPRGQSPRAAHRHYRDRHPRIDFLTEKWEHIAAFGESNEGWLRQFLSLPHGIPSPDTFAGVFSRIAPEELNERIVSSAALLTPRPEAEIVNIHGKPPRSAIMTKPSRRIMGASRFETVGRRRICTGSRGENASRTCGVSAS